MTIMETELMAEVIVQIMKDSKNKSEAIDKIKDVLGKTYIL